MPARLAPEMISLPVSNVQRFLPVAALTAWNRPSLSPMYTVSAATAAAALNGPALYSHFFLPVASSSA